MIGHNVNICDVCQDVVVKDDCKCFICNRDICSDCSTSIDDVSEVFDYIFPNTYVCEDCKEELQDEKLWKKIIKETKINKLLLEKLQYSIRDIRTLNNLKDKNSKKNGN